MKRRILITICTLCLIFSCFSFASAASAYIGSSTSVIVGESVTLTVKVSGSGLRGGYFIISVDDPSGILSYEGHSAGTGTVTANYPTFLWEASDAVNGNSEAVMYLNYRTKGVGKATVSLSTSDFRDVNGKVDCGGDYATITANNPAKSGDNSLASITPSKGELVPAFSSGVNEYSITVEYADEEVVIGYKTSHSGASASISGSNTLAVGNNERTITVTAANGSTNRYKINIVRAAEDGALPDGTNLYEIRKQNALRVDVDGVGYLLMDDIKGYKVPAGFEQDVIKYNDFDIPIFTAKKTGIKMAYALPIDKDKKVVDDTKESANIAIDQTNTPDSTTTIEDTTKVEDNGFSGGVWVFYDENTKAFLPAYALKGDELIDYAHFLLFGDGEEPEEEPSIFDDELLILVIIGTLAVLFIVIVCLQISIISGKRKEKKKAKLEENKLKEVIEEKENSEVPVGFGKVTIEDIENITNEEKTSEESEVKREETDN